MTLSQKILYCRKKEGLSQEALAERLGVSRQAVSKWETADAVPELGKLALLAQVFHVTADWLLSEQEPEPEAPPENGSPVATAEAAAESGVWVDHIPGVIGKLIRRYGWLYGVYTAIAGFFFTLFGVVARALTRTMISSFDGGWSGGFDPGTVWYDEAGNLISVPSVVQDASAAGNPVMVLGTVMMVLGILMLIAGVILAVYLKTRAPRDAD